jgi:alanine dehydrogenase
MALIISTARTKELIGMPQALASVQAIFHDRAQGKIRSLPRRRLKASQKQLNIMAAWHETWDITCLRAYGGAANTITLYDGKTGEMLAIINMRYLSSLRTGATSGVAAQYLAPANAPLTLGIIGPGRQGRFQLEAIAHTVPIPRILVFGRHPVRRDDFIREMSKSLPAVWQQAESAAEVEANADILVVSTSSSTPIIDGQGLKEQVLVISIGANGRDKHEVSTNLIRVMDLIVTDDLATAQSGSGDLIAACDSGVVQWNDILPLEKIVAAGAPFPRPPRILFQSNGMADEDLAVGRYVFEQAKERNFPLTKVTEI